jgi:hypothetical protein
MHPFWSSHKEKRACVRLSMGGQPWPELELHDRPWECSLERGERRKKRVKEWGSLGARHGGS